MNTTEPKSSLPEILQKALFPVTIDYMSKVTEDISRIAVTSTVKNSSYRSEVEKILRDSKKELRESIYKKFISKKVLRKYPDLSQVIPLEGSDFQKCIIIMAGIDVEVEDMCGILQTCESSILTQRSKRSKDIERIFGRKPWMKI